MSASIHIIENGDDA